MAQLLVDSDLQQVEELYRRAITVQQEADFLPYRQNLASIHYGFAKFLQRHNRPDKAIEEFQKATAILKQLVIEYPYVSGYQTRLAGYQRLLAALLKETDRTDEANRLLLDVIAANPRTAEQYATRAGLYSQLKHHSKALADYERASELQPDNADILIKLTAVYQELKQNDKALALFGKRIAADPENAKLYETRGTLYQKSEQHEKALADYNKMIEVAGEKATANHYRLRGYIHLNKLPQYNKALPDFLKLVELAPNYLSGHIYLARTYWRLQEYDKALAEFNEILKRDPHQELAVVYRWNDYRYLKQNDKVLAVFDKLIAADPENAELYQTRGTLYQKSEQFEKALADFEKTLELNPDYAVNCNNTAWFIVRIPGMKTKLTQLAVALAQKAVELKPKSASFSNTLGVAEYRAENWPEAIVALQKSEQLYKDSHRSVNGFFLSMAHGPRPLAHWQLGDKNTAHECYKKSVQWMEKNKPDDWVWIHFRAEADGLLGIPTVAKKPAIQKSETRSQKTVKQTIH